MTFSLAPKWHLLAAALIAVWGLGVASSQASILLPESPQFDEEQFLAECAAQSTAGSSSAAEGATQPASDQSETPELIVMLVAQMLHAPSPMGSSTSGTSTSSGPSGSGGMSCLMAATLSIVGDGDCVERVAGEQALLLPDTPGTELFHPPRDSRS